MNEKLDPQLKFLQQESQQSLTELAALDRFAVEVEGVSAPTAKVLIQFRDSLAPIEAAGFQRHIVAGDVATGEVALDDLDAVAALPNVVKIEGARPMQPELDVSRPEIRANQVHAGSPAFKGAGVIVGIIDSGIDYTHRCFRKADGTSRILFIWDQSLTPTGSESNPTGYTYGVEYTKSNIDAALATANPFSAVRHRDGDTVSGHGTHVAGIAAGNGSVAGNGKPANTFVGVAPEADLIVVANTLTTNALGDSVTTLEAVKYIFDKAAALGKPAVINQSQGDNIGPHDGTSLLERGIDNLLGGPGRSMVKSAGNAGSDNIHARGTVTAGGTETVRFSMQPGDASPEIIDIWYAGSDRLSISLTTPGGAASAVVTPGTTTTLNLSNGNRVFVDSVLNDPNNHDNRIQFVLSRGTSATIQQGTWSFNLRGDTVVDGRFHAWIQRGRTIAAFTGTHRDNNGTISIPGTSREVIAVGSYITKASSGVGGLSSFSSRGPTRDGREKPDLSAPGQLIMSARASNASGSDQYHQLQGTSMAAPHVAGVIALVLQKNPKLTQQQIRNGLTRTARSDAATGTVPNNDWGFGKVDARAAVDFSYPAETTRNWVRIRPLLANWVNGPQPPTFEISADENGTAVVELAWDPQALLAPANYPAPRALRYYSSDANFNATVTRANGSALTVTVPAQSIQLGNNRATWTMPQALWDGYLEEARKSPLPAGFTRNLYYRVRLQPVGASAALVWPPDTVVRNNPDAPHMGILPVSATPATQGVPDPAAVQAMGGIPLVLPTLWSDLLTWFWQNLPASDPNRQVLERIFNHEVFRTEITDAGTRGKILKLWLFAGPGSRARLPQLLDRRVRSGANAAQPAVTQRDLKNRGTLVDNLLELLFITPHPDMVGVTVAEQLVDDVLTEILDPNGQTNQGRTGDANPTSIQALLIHVNPAEYVRLQLGLLSAAGSVQLANGTDVTVPPAIFQVARYAGAQTDPFYIRTNAELAFQATLMKYAMGARFPAYNPTADPGAPDGVNTVFQATMRGGLTSAEMDRALEGLFNVPFTTSAAGPSQAIRDAFLAALSTAPQPLLVSLFWGGSPNTPGTAGSAVLALRHDAGRIFFKNPEYPGSAPPAGAVAGSSRNNPPRRIEDPAAALESIGDNDLSSWIMWYHVPAQPA